MFKKKFKKETQPLWKSFYHALEGIRVNLLKERNLVIHFCFVIAVVTCGLIFSISKTEWIICLLLFGLVISSELMNTAIETAIDICMPEINPKAKLAKDTAAGAVLAIAVIAAIIGLIIFIPKLFVLI